MIPMKTIGIFNSCSSRVPTSLLRLATFFTCPPFKFLTPWQLLYWSWIDLATPTLQGRKRWGQKAWSAASRYCKSRDVQRCQWRRHRSRTRTALGLRDVWWAKTVVEKSRLSCILNVFNNSIVQAKERGGLEGWGAGRRFHPSGGRTKLIPNPCK